MGLDVLSDCAAIFVALCALVLSIYQMKITKKHHELSLKPFISSFERYSLNAKTEEFIGFEIVNKGIGPAIIEDFKMYVLNEDQSITEKNNPREVLESLDLYECGFVIITPIVGELIAPDERFWIIKRDIEKNEDRMLEYSRKMKRIGFTLKYKSAFNEKSKLKILPFAKNNDLKDWK